MTYDLAIIGAGWAGFNAALRAKELGIKACLIEKDEIGGTCLNKGCIPTKTLIQSAKIYNITQKSHIFGIDTANPRPDFNKIQERKAKIIQQLRQGMQSIIKGIPYLNGQAQILSHQEIAIGSQTIKTKFILIASGSKPAELPDFKFDGKKIISSDDLLNLTKIPRSLLVIGGGVIGCEFASLFSTLGTQVSIVEKMPQLLPGLDIEIAKKIENNFKKKGIKANTDMDVKNTDITDYDLVLLCIGRKPNLENLGTERINLRLEKNSLLVDEYLRTNIDNIYAAGDCTGQIMLAHFASYAGCRAVENIANLNNPERINSANIPNCIFTEPEIASVGLTEEDARKKNINIQIKKFDFMGSGMARILDETEGFIKIISGDKTGQILGASIIGARATELIGIMTLAVSARLKISQIKDTIFAHPTLSETISEALR